MKRKIKVTAVKWIELDVEAGYRQPFDQIQRFDVDDIEWDAEVMEGTE